MNDVWTNYVQFVLIEKSYYCELLINDVVTFLCHFAIFDKDLRSTTPDKRHSIVLLKILNVHLLV
jgi:hypothetical protein